ncbi:MAG TPA: transcription-repair coupling factor [Chitinivibrionales bacterium]|nr:transcription-repair coupling factor [Chitinivibrionales bacterium]
MPIDPLSKLLSRGTFPGIAEWLGRRPESALFTGCAGSSDAFLVSSMFAMSGKSVLVCVENSKRTEVLASECASLLGEDSVALFPSRDAVPYNMKSPFGPVVESRIRVLSDLLNGKKAVYVAPHAALFQKVPPPREIFNRIIRLDTGREISIATLSAWLTDNGFRRETVVSDLGTFCVRGGIVDIYPFISDGPVRLEFFGDVIESIREFDVFSQKTTQVRQSVEIFPMKEYCITGGQIETGLAALGKFATDKHGDEGGFSKLSHQWKTLLDHDGIEWFFHWFSLPEATLFDYLPGDAVFVWDDLLPPGRRFDECVQNYSRHLERVPAAFRPYVSPPEKLLIAKQEITDAIGLFARVFVGTAEGSDAAWTHACAMAEQPAFPQAMEPLIADLNAHNAAGDETVIVCGNQGYAERLLELIGQQCPFVKVCTGFLSRGFVDKTNRRLYYTDLQIFNRQPTRQIVHKKERQGAALPSYDALSPGDYVVHIDHGIGKFVGIEHIVAGGAGRDCMVIAYHENARLSVPVEDFHKVQKYIGKESVVPALSKLGTAAWERLKARTKESLREMAQELIELYAKRQYYEGIQFSKDTMWQKEFEDAFVYEETPDQARAIAEVKADMESKKPMDRLVCGDVGFGKTEVAMRAAFKAVMDGYQVAVLAPTTILAAQHFATFRERMADFPVRIAMLSRFLSAKEQREVVAKVKDGVVDVLIGTHRLLSKDLLFKNLGLLVVDEEQRFGVRHKERLKQYRYKVDVLSMTATPIPRTLHMSLIGARDLSIINTPPRNRLPIETHVMEYHDEIVKTAIENEIERGGQVYAVHNRIQTLGGVCDRIEALVPRARVVCAHGQMHERELERIMKEFIAGRYDVLVSTVIIENGLDIPNVNTIIVNRADTMGLSQLYQLRGRVGRSSEQAFAYFLAPSFKEAREISLRRLRVLEQYTDLGSGFQIAMRDLEIRGAGNILGVRQHGFIAAVGFELYCRLLEETVKELRGEAKPAEKEKELVLDIPLEAYIPTDYIEDGGARIAVYQELSASKSAADVDEVERAIADRFGPMPESVLSLLLLMKIKVLGRVAGCSKVSIAQDGILGMFFEGEAAAVRDAIGRVFSKSKRRFEIVNGEPVQLRTALSARTVREQALEARDVLAPLA